LLVFVCAFLFFIIIEAHDRLTALGLPFPALLAGLVLICIVTWSVAVSRGPRFMRKSAFKMALVGSAPLLAVALLGYVYSFTYSYACPMNRCPDEGMVGILTVILSTLVLGAWMIGTLLTLGIASRGHPGERRSGEKLGHGT
jgi:hypothetical protein